MPRTRALYRCDECGAAPPRWVGRCPECQAWGTVGEVGAPAAAAVSARAVVQPALPMNELDPALARASPTGVGELDRVLGGGLVAGSVVLLAGEPGIGKSTLLLAMASQWARSGNSRALIVSGEESTAQVRARAERTGCTDPRLFLAAENDVGAAITHIDQVMPGLIVLDSIQTFACEGVDGTAGGVPQIRAVAATLIALAKSRGIATVIVGHVTKDGSIAGPRLLEHLVDVVLVFEGDRHSALRLLRATKNRFGAADEVGCFEMRESGIAGLADPSGLFLSDRAVPVAGTCATVTVEGLRPLVTEVQALTVPCAGGPPRRVVTGLDSARVAMVAAVLAAHRKLNIGERDVYAATLGGLQTAEPAADLAVALALESAMSGRPLPAGLCAIGEVSLSGDVRRVRGLERRLAEAARLGFTTALVPAARDGLPPGGAGVPAILGVPAIRSLPVATVGDASAAVGDLRRNAREPPAPVPIAVHGGVSG